MKYSLNSSTDGHRILNENSSAYSKDKNGSLQTNENRYSINDTINKYVIAMKDINQNISRVDLAKLPIEYQKPIFRSLSNENKLRIFIEKTEQLIRTEKLSEQEQNHLKSIIAFFKPEYYESKYDEVVQSFAKRWTEKSKILFNWNIDLIKQYVGTILMPTEIIKLLNNNIECLPIGAVPGQSDCACFTKDDWCMFSDCSHGFCSPSLNGCGWWWRSPCNGLCNSASSIIE